MTTARETLGLRPGERGDLAAMKAALRLGKPLVGLTVRHSGEVQAVELGERYFDNIWHPTTDAEPIAKLSVAEVCDLFVWCCELIGINANKVDGKTTATIWERLRVDFSEPPRRT